MPIGVVTYTSHLRLEHELDDSSSSGIDDVLFTTGSSSSTLVEELSSALPRLAERGELTLAPSDMAIPTSWILALLHEGGVHLHHFAYFHPVVERVYLVLR